MKKFFAALALILAASACAEVLNGDDESAPTSTAPARPPTGNLRSDYYTTVGSYVTTADGRRERGCASTDTVYDGEGTCHVGGETVVVREVLDGDTVDLADGRRVRILGVDTPEVGTCGADVATAYTRGALIGNRLVVLHREPGVTKDQYGRELGYLQYVGSDTDEHWAAPASEDLGANLAIEGLADVYEGGGANATYMAKIRSSVEIAKQVRGGVWGLPCGEPAPTYEPAPEDESDSDVYVDTDNDEDDGGESWFCRRRRWC
jgi:endonuclease YncB( thermonuclease family)